MSKFDSRCICGHPTHANIGGCGVCRAENCKCEYLFNWPESDEHGTPKVKLPCCPRCGKDELGLIHPELLLCYACRWQLFKCDYDLHPRAFA